MKFDLFDAMRIMKKELGETSEIRVLNIPGGIGVRLSVFKNGQFHHNQFNTLLIELENSNVRIMNMKFERSIASLKHYLTKR